MTLTLLACVAGHLYAQLVTRGTSEHFVLDHNRVFVELAFVRPDGTQRKVLAFVDSGDPTFTFRFLW